MLLVLVYVLRRTEASVSVPSTLAAACSFKCGLLILCVPAPHRHPQHFSLNFLPLSLSDLFYLLIEHMITASDTHTHTHTHGGTCRKDLWQHTTVARDKHPCARRDSNPQPQQASDQTHALDRATTGIDLFLLSPVVNSDFSVTHYIGAFAGELPEARGVDNRPERKIMMRVLGGRWL